MEFRLRKADGTYVWVNDTATLVPDDQGFAYSVGFGADINDRKLLEEELTIAKSSLESQVRKRTAELRATNRQLKGEIARRKTIEEELLRIEEREKTLLGRELHDDIGQRLNSLRLFQEGLSEKFGGVLGTPAGPMALRPKRRAKEPCDSVSPSEDWQRFCTLVDGTQSALRNLSHRLCAVDLNAHTFAAKVEEFMAEIGRTFRVGTHLTLQPDVRPLDQEAACHLFRILQESVANGLKHGKPKNLFVTFQGKKGKGEFAIRNDGQDFPGSGAIRTGIGLHSMETRCRLLGGTLFLGKPGTGGMLVRCRIPVQASSESVAGRKPRRR
jgi:signal transduction histidine kinase